MEELAYSLNKITGGYGDVDWLEKTTVFNRMNYGLRESTTDFVTKKLYNIESGDFFGFNSETNRVVNAVFGMNDEILSQFMLGIDFARVEQTLGTPVSDLRFTFDYNKLREFRNKLKIHIFSEYFV